VSLSLCPSVRPSSYTLSYKVSASATNTGIFTVESPCFLSILVGRRHFDQSSPSLTPSRDVTGGPHSLLAYLPCRSRCPLRAIRSRRRRRRWESRVLESSIVYRRTTGLCASSFHSAWHRTSRSRRCSTIPSLRHARRPLHWAAVRGSPVPYSWRVPRTVLGWSAWWAAWPTHVDCSSDRFMGRDYL